MCKLEQGASSCIGCPVIEVIATVARIDNHNVEELALKAATVCPNELSPQITEVYRELYAQEQKLPYVIACEIEAQNVQ